MRATDIRKSDIGAQAAWKGFTSQTLYIANRLISDNDGYEFYPEDVEDLIIRNNGAAIDGATIFQRIRYITIPSIRRLWEFPKVCVNLYTDVRYTYQYGGFIYG